MRIAVLGTGDVGTNLASKFVQLRHEVKLGSRTATNEKAVAWVKANGQKASCGTFTEAAKFGEIVFNCTNGAGSLEALRMAGDQNLKGKTLVDVSNPLDFSKGMPPALFVCNTDSLGEQIQRAHPEARVVKALNTMNLKIMTNPTLVHGDHDVLICGNDATAKKQVTGILKEGFGWKTVIDLGDITAARGMEMWLPLWLRLAAVNNYGPFNLKVAK